MTIVQILPQLNIGGVERGTFDFALYLKDKGHKSIIISAGGRLVEELEANGVAHYTLPVDKKNLFTMLYCIKEVKKILLKEKVDIIHGRSRMPDWIAYWASLKTTTQLIFTGHGCHSYHFFSRIIDFSKILIVPSATTARYFVDKFKVSDSKINVIYRGLDLKKFSFVEPKYKKDNFNVAYVGRLSPIKGVEYVIDAINDVLKTYPKVHCHIIGAAHEKHKKYEIFLKDKVKRMGLDKHITFCGVCDVPSKLEDMKALVLPSLVPETFGRVLTEAAAKGVACVATDLGAPKEIIDHNESGILVPAFDSAGISEALKKYFADQDFFTKVVEKAHIKVKSLYTLDKMCSSTVDVYEKLLKKKNIVVAKLASLGDVVLATASFKALKEEYPNSRLMVIVEKRFFKVLSSLDIIDEILIFDQDKNKYSQILHISSILRKKNIDLFIDIQNNSKSQMLSFLSCSKKSIGVGRKFGFVHDIKIDYKALKDLSPISSQAKILEPLNLLNKITRPYLKADENIAKGYRDQMQLQSKTKVLGINMGASAKWLTKTPELGLYKEILSYLDKWSNIKVVLIGTAEYSVQAKELKKMFPGLVHNFCAKTSVHELVSLMSICDFFISPDSAPLHISIALDIPCLAFFGPTDPKKHVDSKDTKEIEILRDTNLDCLSCYNKTCSHKSCMNFDSSTIIKTLEKYLLN